MFLTWDDAVRFLREIRRMPQPEVDEELRGWSWSESVVASSMQWPLGVSDITSNFCPRGRDVYLRYVLKVRQGDNETLQVGRLVHEVFGRAVVDVKRIIYGSGGNIDGKGLYEIMRGRLVEIKEEVTRKYSLLRLEDSVWLFERLWDEAARTYSAALDKAISRSPHMALESLVVATVPIMTEFPIDGSLIGLSRALRIDAFLPPSLLVELKTRKPDPVYELSLAGYALAFEAHYEIPVNYGILIYVNVDFSSRKIFTRPVLVPVGSKARSEFIELRDKRKEILMYGEDPGTPDYCPRECPFLRYCRGGSDG